MLCRLDAKGPVLCRLDASSQMGCDGWVVAGMACGSRVAGNDGQWLGLVSGWDPES